VLRSAADVRPETPRWAWEGRLPLGAVSLLAGREGLGKSTVTIELGACLTRGELPGDLHGEPCNVVYATAEDSPQAIVVPRLMAAGADLERVSLIEVVARLEGDEEGADVELREGLTLPADLPKLAEAVCAAGARLLVFDPLVSYLSAETNAHRDQDVRRVLAPLARFADEHHIAVLGVMHLNKGETTDMLARVSGSIGFTAGARSVLAFARDTNDPDGESGSLRAIAHAKCNVGPLAATLLARIEPRTVATPGGDGLETSGVVLLGESDQTPRDLLEPPASAEERTAQDEAADFLRAELGNGPVATARMRKAADDAGIAWRTLERAKKPAGVKASKGSSGGWEWALVNPEPLPLVTPCGGLGGLPSLEPNNSANNSAKTAKTATAKGVEGRGDLRCTCREPARSPRANGPDHCQDCKRSIADEVPA